MKVASEPATPIMEIHSASRSSCPSLSLKPVGVWSAGGLEAEIHEGPESPHKQNRPTRLQMLRACYHWATWTFICVMVFSQFLSIGWDSTTNKFPLSYGQNPLEGPIQIIGYNDIPYDDRVIVCVKNSNNPDDYQPWQVSELKTSSIMTLVDSTGTSKTGYRIYHRETTTPLVIDSLARETYAQSCSLIAATIDNILDACSALGYANLNRDLLRIVDGIDSDDMYEIPDSLPILIMPFWNNAPLGRHAVPTWDGDACIFRLDEAYMSPEMEVARFRGVNQTIRQARTIDWLNLESDGEWRNGWYEDPTGMRWYTDVVSSWDDPRYHMMHRQFDMRNGEEFDCVNTEDCRSTTSIPSNWGPKAFTADLSIDINSVFAANGTQFGVFLYECVLVRTVRCIYDWETLLSNMSIGVLLVRWMFSMMALHRGFYTRNSQWHSGGIGCIASAPSFNMLPFAVLPRLKSSLHAFWTVGCAFEGQQIALSESWFAIYPSIVETMLVYYSILNTLAMVLRRRMSDVLFAPSIITLCLLHYFRQNLADSGLLTGVDGRVATQVFSDEVAKLKLVDYFSTNLALRINGNILELFTTKLAILGVNLLPLLLAQPLPVLHDHSTSFQGVEKALAIRAHHVGGLTSSHDNAFASIAPRLSRLRTTVVPFKPGTKKEESKDDINRDAFLNGYHLLRLGYVVYGDKFLIHFADWDVFTLMAPLRNTHHLWNYRVMVWLLKESDGLAGKEVESEYPELWRVDDPRLHSVSFWHISACDIRC